MKKKIFTDIVSIKNNNKERKTLLTQTTFPYQLYLVAFHLYEAVK